MRARPCRPGFHERSHSGDWAATAAPAQTPVSAESEELTRIRQTYVSRGKPPPSDPQHLASCLTALDIGLAIQNLVEQDQVPLAIYPEMFDLLFAEQL